MLVRAWIVLILLVAWTAPSFSLPEDQVSTYATGVSAGKDFAFDSAGNMFVAAGGPAVLKIGPGGSPVTTFATGFVDPWGVVFDPLGNLLVADRGNASVANSGVIWKITPGGAKTVYKSSLQSPIFLAFGPSGDLFFSNWGGLKVQRISSTGVVTEYGSALTVPGEEMGGIVFDNAGNLYIGAGTKLKMVAPGGSPVTTIASGLGSIVGMDRLADGTLFFARYSFRDIWKATPAGVAGTFVGSGNCVDGDAPILRTAAHCSLTGSARMHDGRLFFTDAGCNRVRVVDFATAATKETWGRVKSIYRR